MKVLAILASVLLVVAGQSPVRFSLNVPGIDAWRLALDQHAAAEGRLTGFVRTPAGPTQSLPAVPRPPVPPPTPPVTLPAHIAGNVNFQGIPQWQLHQQAVLTAERQLEQLQTTPSPMTTTSMAPEISSSSADPLDRVTKNTKIVENFIAEIQSDTSGGKTSAIAQLLQQVKNKSKKIAPVQPSRSAASVDQLDDLIRAAPGRPRSFLDNLLSSLTAKPVEEEVAVTNEIEQEDLVQDQVEDQVQVAEEDSISEILKLLTVKESKPQKKKKVEKDDGISDILALLSGVAPKPKTKTSQPKLSLAELLSLDLPAPSPAKKKEILRPTKEDILAESIIAQLFSNDEEQSSDRKTTKEDILAESIVAQLFSNDEEQSSAVNIGRASSQDQLANEINEFLDILAEIDPSLDRSKSVVNSRLSVLDEEEERRGRVSAKAPRVSNFIQEELTEAAEESVQLSDDLDQLLRELEVEKKKDLKFVEETYDIINAKLRGGNDVSTILKDDEFVDSVFHRFAILGFPLRREDLSIKDLMDTKKLVTQNIIAAAEQNKRIALGIIKQLDAVSR